MLRNSLPKMRGVRMLGLLLVLASTKLAYADDDSLWDQLDEPPEDIPEEPTESANSEESNTNTESSPLNQQTEDNTNNQDTAQPEPEEPPPPPTTEELLRLIDLSKMGIPIRQHEDVIAWIDWFRGPGRSTLALWIRRSGKYRSMISKELRKAGLPQELLYVAMIESGFVETAESHASAVGVWQFIPSTGQRYNLRVDEMIDERRDPFLSTQAAIQYLQFLYYSFGYWPAALAGYNAGEGQVHNALFKHGTIDFWVLSDADALPEETMGYVPKILAVAVMDKHPAVFGFQSVRQEVPVDLIRVMVNGGTHIDQMAEASGMTIADFSENNPHILSTRLPTDRAEYHVYVPPAILNDFTREMRRMGVDRISSGRSMSEAEAAVYAPKPDVSIKHHARRFVHVVDEGELLGEIAQRYLLSEVSLREWNGLAPDADINEGQALWLKPQTPKRSKWLAHDVERGDSLRSLARRYDCTVDDIMSWNNLEEPRIPTAGSRLWLKVVEE